MKFHICCQSSKFFTGILTSLVGSLRDLGHLESNYDNSELIFGIKLFPSSIQKEKGKRYFLIQTEQYNHNPQGIEKVYNFKPDKVLGFDIDNKREEYFPIGYHPSLEVHNISPERDIKKQNVSLLGAETDRRIIFRSKIKNHFNFIKEYNITRKVNMCKQTTINLNIHSYENAGRFCEWDRISLLLANKCFFMSEDMYCPLKDIIYFNIDNYDKLVEDYSKDKDLRFMITESLYKEYYNKLDMRKIMENILR